jgi:hypothetical protein
MDRLHVVLMGSLTAARHERMTHRIPEGVGLGWKPYTVLVSSHGGTLPYKAFHGVRAFKAWLGERRLSRFSRQERNGSRYSLATCWID